MDPRIALVAACVVTVYSYYAVWVFLNGEDEESDTDWNYFFLGLGLSVIVWSLVIGVPMLLAVLWSALLPGYRIRFRKVPGFAGWPLLGNLLQVQESWHGVHEQGAAKYGPVFKLWYGAEPHVVTASSETSKQVLTKCPMVSEFPVPLFGDDRQVLLDGLPFAKTLAYHRTLRAAWAPAFNPSSLAAYQPIMAQHADRLVDALSKVADTGEGVDVWQLLVRTSMAIVASTGFGVDVDVDFPASNGTASNSSSHSTPSSMSSTSSPSASLGNRVVTAFQVILDASRPSNTGFWLPVFLMLHPACRWPVRLLAWLLPDATMRGVQRAQREIRSVATTLIKQERQKQKQEAVAEASGTVAGDKEKDSAKPQVMSGIQPGSFLKHLLTYEDKTTGRLSEAEVVANAYAFMGGGAETPANTIAYTIYQLALHPEHEDRLLQELDGGSASQYEQQNLAEAFPFVHACLCEAMRTMPPVSKLLRETSNDMVLAGIPVAKGTKFEVSLRCAMRDPEAWKDPLLFQPARFLPEETEWQSPDPSAFMPFGGGQRLCIGHKFAQQLAKLVLVKLYQRYTFELEPGVAPLRVATGISMAPVDGLRVRVHRRLAPTAKTVA